MTEVILWQRRTVRDSPTKWLSCGSIVLSVFKPNSIHNYKSEGYGDFMDLEFLMFIVTEVNIEQKSAFRPSFVKDG